MYEELFQLTRRPFSATPDPACFFECDSNLVVIEELLDCVDRCKGIAVLTAAPGMGKTLICQRLASILSSPYETIYLGNGKFPTCRSLLQAIMFEMGVEYSRKDEDEIRLELRAALNILRPEKEALVIIVDEAHLHQAELLEELRTLSDVAEDGRPLVRLILAGQIEFEEQLGQREMSAINQRIGAQLCLLPFSHTESLNYMHHRMEWAGGHADTALTPQAQNLISRASGGVPRCLNQLADHTLLLSFAANDVPASEDRVREALEDLKQLPLHWNDVNDSIGNLPENDFDDIDDFADDETVFSASANDAVTVGHHGNPLGEDEIGPDELPIESSAFEFGSERSEVSDSETNQPNSGGVAGLVLDLFFKSTPEEAPSEEAASEKEAASAESQSEEIGSSDSWESNAGDPDENAGQTAFFEFGAEEDAPTDETTATQESVETTEATAVEEESTESCESTCELGFVSDEQGDVLETASQNDCSQNNDQDIACHADVADEVHHANEENRVADQTRFETVVIDNPSIRRQEPHAQEVVWNLSAWPAESSDLASRLTTEKTVGETPNAQPISEPEQTPVEDVTTESTETEQLETEPVEIASTETTEAGNETSSDFAVGVFDDTETDCDESSIAQQELHVDSVSEEAENDHPVEAWLDHSDEAELANSTPAELVTDETNNPEEDVASSETRSSELTNESSELEEDEPVTAGAPSVAELARAFGIVNLDDSPAIESSRSPREVSYDPDETVAESVSPQSDQDEAVVDTEAFSLDVDGQSEDAQAVQDGPTTLPTDEVSEDVEVSDEVEDSSDNEQLNKVAESVDESLSDSGAVVSFQEFHQPHDADPDLDVISDEAANNEANESDAAVESGELDSVYGLQESEFSADSADNTIESAEDEDHGIRDIRPDRYLDAIRPMLDELNQDGSSGEGPSGQQFGRDIERELVESVSHDSSDIEDEIGSSVLDLCLDTQWAIQNGGSQGDEELDEEEQEFDPADFDIVEPEMEEPPTVSTPDPEPIAGEPQESAPRRRRPLGSLFSDLRRRRDSQ